MIFIIANKLAFNIFSFIIFWEVDEMILLVRLISKKKKKMVIKYNLLVNKNLFNDDS